MVEAIKVSDGKIVIPENIRNNLDIKDGSTLMLIEKDGFIIIKKKNKSNNKIDYEKLGWMYLAENSFKKLWDNKKDDEIWSKYL
ncbi:AbrB/MazE/SpoVT family DNA-binding domain-containing protein [Candidatus Woesearchaeota archaeon]|nr:MAG: hypothetical protein QT09_C0012G0053 [archaeon GW2011_AR18]MBS3161359.1 AbrB/MazE/SpoVT family DNA-binding domain-containing protein [Candidatus Woesearchaeota archaeon]HIH25391.1 AbrB/MazE/SpoVT family DNA-binding domain-containing protein [Nanoarchaeota archaeon]